VSDEEDELRRLLAARAGRVHSTLSGPAIRARAEARRPLRRYAPVLTAAAVLAVLVIGFVLLQRGSSPEPAQVPPAATVTTTTTTVTTSPSSAPTETPTTHSQVSTAPVSTTATTASR
jgi:hypothetical protein